MKKVTAIVMLILCTFLTACTKNLDNIPSLELVRQYGNKWSLEKLEGYTPDQLQEVWGKYDSMLSGMYGYIWEINGSNDYVVIYFDNKNKVNAINNISVMKAEITEVTENAITVKPAEDEWERNTSDIISIATAELPNKTKSRLEVGKTVIVRYNGVLAESYPAQITKPYEITFEAAIPSDLTDEEKAILDSMPEIVTMRAYQDYKNNTTEILYIKKNGEARSFVSTDSPKIRDTEWVKEQIDKYEGTIVDAVNVHKLIDFYNTFLLIDEESLMSPRQLMSMNVVRETTHWYEIYAVKNDTVDFISCGTLFGGLAAEHTKEDPNGDEAYFKYIEIDPFIKINHSGFTP